ncbi:Hypothetical protein NTJ_10134 [Nesidiocoris tenuis]|nr:Hypothetical protein NTJ_10134 [Nesidiocoris tenuis]
MLLQTDMFSSHMSSLKSKSPQGDGAAGHSLYCFHVLPNRRVELTTRPFPFLPTTTVTNDREKSQEVEEKQ